MKEKIKEFIIIFKKEHKYLYWTIILSFILAILPFLYCLFTFFLKYKLTGWIFLIPFFIILALSLLASYTYKYIPKITKFITFVLNTFIIVIFQMLIGILVLSFLYLHNESYMYDKPKYYEKVLELFLEERVAHFPKKIPAEATNIKMEADINYWFGSDGFALKFDIDEEYIRKELGKYKFKYSSGPNEYVFSTMLEDAYNEFKDVTFYVIDGKLERFGKNYGIGVDKDFTKIIYYYSNPD